MAWQETWDTADFTFGETIVNSKEKLGDPNRIGLFVRHGVLLREEIGPWQFVELTDGRGEFWKTYSGTNHKLAPLMQPT
jgi:hypothetical protein